MEFKENLPFNLNVQDSGPLLNNNFTQWEKRSSTIQSNNSFMETIIDKGSVILDGENEIIKPQMISNQKDATDFISILKQRAKDGNRNYSILSPRGKEELENRKEVEENNISPLRREEIDEENKDQLMDLAEPTSLPQALNTYHQVTRYLKKRKNKSKQRRVESTSQNSQGRTNSASSSMQESSDYNSDGDKVIAIDDMDSEEESRNQETGSQKIENSSKQMTGILQPPKVYQKHHIGVTTSLGEQSQNSFGLKRQTVVVDMFSELDQSKASAGYESSDVTTSVKQQVINAKTDSNVSKLDMKLQLQSPNFAQNSRFQFNTDRSNAQKQVIDDLSFEQEEAIEESGNGESFINDQMSMNFRDKSMYGSEDVTSSKSQTVKQSDKQMDVQQKSRIHLGNHQDQQRQIEQQEGQNSIKTEVSTTISTMMTQIQRDSTEKNQRRRQSSQKLTKSKKAKQRFSLKKQNSGSVDMNQQVA